MALWHPEGGYKLPRPRRGCKPGKDLKIKLCHAAALALVGWYLMIPPINANHHPDDGVPISAWKVLSILSTRRTNAEVNCLRSRHNALTRMYVASKSTSISVNPNIHQNKIGHPHLQTRPLTLELGQYPLARKRP